MNPHSLVEEGRRAYGVPGLSVAPTDRKRTLWAETFGEAEIAGSRPVEAETLFQIGSVSKSFAALAVLREVDRASLELDVPVTEYLPPARRGAPAGGLRAGGDGPTEAVVTNALRGRSAVGYEPLDDSFPWHPGAPVAPAPWAETDSAAGSISSTAEDLAAYVRLFLRGGGVVSPERLGRMSRPPPRRIKTGTATGTG